MWCDLLTNTLECPRRCICGLCTRGAPGCPLAFESQLDAVLTTGEGCFAGAPQSFYESTRIKIILKDFIMIIIIITIIMFHVDRFVERS